MLIALQSGRRQIREQLEAVASLKYIEIKSWIQTLLLDLNVELRRSQYIQPVRIVLQESPDPVLYQQAYSTLTHRLKETTILRPEFEALFLLNTTGKVIVASDPLREGELWDWYPYFRAGLTGAGVYVQTESYSGVEADFNAVFAVHPVHDDLGNTVGVLVGRASLSALDAIMLDRTGMGSTGETYLVGTNKSLLTHSRFPGYQLGQMYIHTENVIIALRDQTRGFTLYENYRRIPAIGVYHWIPELQVVLVAEREQREAFQPIYDTIRLNLILTVLAMLVITVIALSITRRIATPITTLAETARQIAEGDLDQVVHVESLDEIGDLAKSFNMMTIRLGEMLRAEAERATALEQEIAERKQIEKILRESKAVQMQLLLRIREQAQQVQQIIDTVPEGVLLLDATGKVLHANPLGQTNIAILANAKIGDTLTCLGEQPLETLLTSPPKGLWHELVLNNHTYQVLARAIETKPAPGNWVIVIRDVTQQRDTERRVQQQEQLAVVGQMAAGIAHDFNNIMAAIVLYAQMTARSPGLSDRDRERMAVINQQAQHAAKLIQQILDFSRRAILERRPLTLLPLVKEQVQLLGRTLPENIQITFDAAPGEYTLKADPTRIQQILMNLALNARDAMPDGGELRIGLAHQIVTGPHDAPVAEITPGDWICLTVSDTGTGIAPDVLSHIFQPFFTTKAPGQGTGLGLSQVYGIVGIHEGHIDVKTTVGEGTTFIIYLPALAFMPSFHTQEEEKELLRGEGQTILIVEDEATVRAALAESLLALNYHVLEAANGQDALHLLDTTDASIALILSDVVMPKMGGVTLLNALRERGIPIPVIFSSGHPLDTAVKDLKGVAGWLTKPVQLEQLAEVLAQTLNRMN
ncbi:MAG: response regulator [Anaerolineae bacterium]|nr:response regulator [Anaerolineae bacterium]